MTSAPVRHPWTLVARRELATKLVDRTFLVGTLLTLALIVGIVVVQAVLSERAETYEVVATAPATAMAETVAERATDLDDKVRVTVVPVLDDAAAEAALEDEEADAWLTTRDGSWVLVGYDDVPRDLEDVTATVVRDVTVTENSAAAGTSVESITAGSELDT